MSSDVHYVRHRPHPWHGLGPGEDAPNSITVFVEMTPLDHVKYELDKHTGFLRVDRPQRNTSHLPCLYGFMPQTYCAERVCALSPQSAQGDHDPLDICVLSERSITRAEITLTARVVGGLQMVDAGEADDKIIAVLEGDHVYGNANDIGDLPPITVERLRHYFLTYKLAPDVKERVSHVEPYGREHALQVIVAAQSDYANHFTNYDQRHD